MKTNKSNFPTEISKQFSLENASFRRSTFKQALVPLKTSTRKYKEKQIIFKKNDYGYESLSINLLNICSYSFIVVFYSNFFFIYMIYTGLLLPNTDGGIMYIFFNLIQFV